MKNALVEGCPFAVAIKVFESFESDEVSTSGFVPIPKPKKEQLLGMQAVICVGFDDSKQCFLMRNSRGPRIY